MSDDNKPRNITVTNNDQGPRYVHTSRGMESIQKGGVLETVASPAQIEAIKGQIIAGTEDAEMFTVADATEGEGTEDAPKPLADMTLAQLRKVASVEEVILTGRKDPADGSPLPDITKADDIRAAIEAKRGATPQA